MCALLRSISEIFAFLPYAMPANVKNARHVALREESSSAPSFMTINFIFLPDSTSESASLQNEIDREPANWRFISLDSVTGVTNDAIFFYTCGEKMSSERYNPFVLIFDNIG